MVQVPALAQLHDQVDVSPGVDDLVQSHDVVVSHVRQDVDLPMQGKGSRFLQEILLVVDFEGYRMLRLLMDRSLDCGKRPLADLETNGEVTKLEKLTLFFMVKMAFNEL